ncbi:hypothetical protein WEI85_00525 [Actinomycetes bacterium KLBMP 9797]
MKADVAFPALLAAARALKPYTTPISWYTPHQRGLRLHTSGDTLTLTAFNGVETAQIDLPGGTTDGGCAIAADTLITALTAIKPTPKAAKTATITLASEQDRLYLAVSGGSAIVLDTDADGDDAPKGPAIVQPTDAAWPVTAGAVADWCDLVGKVGWAASRDRAYPDLKVVRLLRDGAGTTLIVEAGDRYRIHRGCWAQPEGEPVDARIPIAAVERAVKLFTACEPAGRICVDVDDEHIWWRTDRVRLQARTGAEPYLNLEQIREEVCETVNVRFTAGRAELLAALDTAAALAATTRRGKVSIESTGAGAAAVDVTVYADSGGLLHRHPVPVTEAVGPAQALTFNPRFVRQVVAFLDCDTVHVSATAGRLGVYLESGTRHAILMQVDA